MHIPNTLEVKYIHIFISNIFVGVHFFNGLELFFENKMWSNFLHILFSVSLCRYILIYGVSCMWIFLRITQIIHID